MKIVSSDVMREIDRKTIEGGFVEGVLLMERAGRGAVKEIIDFCGLLHEDHVQRFVILCGKGNNGGDGYVIARTLAEQGLEVILSSVCTSSELHGDALFHAEQLPENVLRCDWQREFQRGDVLIDCLLGTGLQSSLREPYLSWIKRINESGCPVIAIDIASGLDGNTGEVHGAAIIADMTLTIGLPKVGFFENRGPEHTGRLKCIDIGFPTEVIYEAEGLGRLVTLSDISGLFPRRSHNAHKYQCGNVAVIGGSEKYAGAPMLAARAAARSGAGMVSLFYPEGTQVMGPDSLIKVPLPVDQGNLSGSGIERCLSSLAKIDTLVIGPGMTGAVCEKPLLEALFSTDKMIVADAGCLTHIAENSQLLVRRAQTVLTPHRGELKRLLEILGLRDAVALAQHFKCYVIVKGQFSKVINPAGEVSFNASGCSSLSTAGSGDVLAGIIGAFASSVQNFQNAIEAAVAVHGLCGELTKSGIRGVIADDFIEGIPEILKKVSCFN